VNIAHALKQLRRMDFGDTADSIPRCRVCQYRLTGLLEPRCPECGTAFDVRLLRDLAVSGHGEMASPDTTGHRA
jgi:hypothetical protein